MHRVSPAARRQLRAFLLQAQWFSAEGGQLTAHQISVLKSLQIFEAHRGTAQDADGHGISPGFCTLNGSEPIVLPPSGLSLQDITHPSRILSLNSHVEEQIVEEHLGIKRLSVPELMESLTMHVGMPRVGMRNISLSHMGSVGPRRYIYLYA